jgi:hypothetical protein
MPLPVAQKERALPRGAVRHDALERATLSAHCRAVAIAIVAVTEMAPHLMRQIPADALGAAVPIHNPAIAIQNIDAFLHLVEQQAVEVSITQSLLDDLSCVLRCFRHQTSTFSLSDRPGLLRA